MWTFSLQLAKGRHLIPTLLVVGGTVELIYADPHDAPYFRSHQRNLDDANDVFDPTITTSEVIALPAGLPILSYTSRRPSVPPASPNRPISRPMSGWAPCSAIPSRSTRR
ncbi:MAG: hypothetical protein WBP85_10410 [Terracidiphilus sp.]